MISSSNKQREEEAKQRKARQDIILNFDKSADYICGQLMTTAENYVAENLDGIISECDKDIKALENKTADAKVKSEKLNVLLKRTENLIGEIQVTH